MTSIYLFYSLVALCVSCGVVILGVTFSSRKNKLIRENLESELKYKEKLHQLELTMLRDQMNPHFVHNSLNSIQYFIQRNEVELSENYLARFSKLMRQFFEHSGKQTVGLDQEISLLENYLYIEKLRFEENLNYTIELDDNFDPEEYSIPPLLIQPIVENAVNHGIFQNQDGGDILIKFQSINESEYHVTVEDNGPGFDLNKPSTERNKKHSSGVIEERIKMMREIGLFDIKLSYHSVNADHINKGTKVELHIKNMSAL